MNTFAALLVMVILGGVGLWAGLDLAKQHTTSGGKKATGRAGKGSKGGSNGSGPVSLHPDGLSPHAGLLRNHGHARSINWLEKKRDQRAHRMEKKRHRWDEKRAKREALAAARPTVRDPAADRGSIIPSHKQVVAGRDKIANLFKGKNGGQQTPGAPPPDTKAAAGQGTGAPPTFGAAKPETEPETRSGIRTAPITDIIPAHATTTVRNTPMAEDTHVHVAVPPDWALTVGRVSDHESEDEGDLLAFMRGEAAGLHAYAEAMINCAETHVNGLGLDPSALQGLTEFADGPTESAEAMQKALKTFLDAYQDVIAAVDNGLVMPHNGRWFKGNAA